MTDDDRKEQQPPRRPPPGDGGDRPLGEFASRLIRAGTEAMHAGAGKLREKGEGFQPREIMSGAVNLTARGKEEVMTLIAKEVRSYMEKLHVGEEIRSFLTDYSLEVKASVSLKPLKPEPVSGVPVPVGDAGGDAPTGEERKARSVKAGRERGDRGGDDPDRDDRDGPDERADAHADDEDGGEDAR